MDYDKQELFEDWIRMAANVIGTSGFTSRSSYVRAYDQMVEDAKRYAAAIDLPWNDLLIPADAWMMMTAAGHG